MIITERAILKVENVVIRDVVSGETLLKVPDWKVNQGSIHGITAPSGTGKSLFLKTLALLTTEENGLSISGQIHWLNQDGQYIDLLSLKPKARDAYRKNIFGMILQEPLASFHSGLRVVDILKDIIRDNKIVTPASISKYLYQLLSGVGLDEVSVILNRYPQELSGGQLQRISIACCLIKQSSIILCDEPTSSLDSIQKLNFIRLVKELNIQLKSTWIIASHDTHLLNAICENIFVLDNKSMQKPTSGSIKIGHRHREVKDCVDPIVQAEKIGYGYRSSGNVKMALSEIDISLYPAQIAALSGPSGCGKTTLGRILSGQFRNYTGTIYYKGKNVTDGNRNDFYQYRKKVQFLFQDAWDVLNPAYNGYDILQQAYRDFGILNKDAQAKIKQVSEQCLIDNRMLKNYPYQLSGGERQRLNLARAFLFEPEVLILDEPLSGIDPEQRAFIYQIIGQMVSEHQLAVLWITHDLEEVKCISHQLHIMWDSKIVETGLTKDILKNPASNATKSLLDASI